MDLGETTSAFSMHLDERTLGCRAAGAADECVAALNSVVVCCSRRAHARGSSSAAPVTAHPFSSLAAASSSSTSRSALAALAALTADTTYAPRWRRIVSREDREPLACAAVALDTTGRCRGCPTAAAADAGRLR